jgi:pimeloyl-ACP methyl ester carboxylesterase
MSSVVTGANILVLHEVGDAAGGGPWRSALGDAGWAAEDVIAPDLPGHAGAPPPVGGGYDPADAAFFAAPLLPAEPGLVVGVGVNGWPAQVFALGGKASGLVLVDGLGGPWHDPGQAIAAGVSWLRAVSADPDAMAPSPPGTDLDPRLRHPLTPMASRSHALRMASSMPVPVLVVESPASGLDPADADDLASHFPTLLGLVRLPDRRPSSVVPAITAAFA